MLIPVLVVGGAFAGFVFRSWLAVPVLALLWGGAAIANDPAINASTAAVTVALGGINGLAGIAAGIGLRAIMPRRFRQPRVGPRERVPGVEMPAFDEVVGHGQTWSTQR